MLSGLLAHARGLSLLQDALGVVDDRGIDHLAVQCDDTQSVTLGLVGRSDDALGIIDILFGRRIGVVQQLDLARIDH